MNLSSSLVMRPSGGPLAVFLFSLMLGSCWPKTRGVMRRGPWRRLKPRPGPHAAAAPNHSSTSDSLISQTSRHTRSTHGHCAPRLKRHWEPTVAARPDRPSTTEAASLACCQPATTTHPTDTKSAAVLTHNAHRTVAPRYCSLRHRQFIPSRTLNVIPVLLC